MDIQIYMLLDLKFLQVKTSERFNSCKVPEIYQVMVIPEKLEERMGREINIKRSTNSTGSKCYICKIFNTLKLLFYP